MIGAAEPAADVDLLAFADQLLHELGIADGVTLQLNTLGDADTRDAWRAALVAHFEQHRGELSEDSLVRLDKNPMRILDSKDPRDRPIADAAPDIDAHLTSDAGAFFEKVTKGLDAAGVQWTRNSRLVRGLDYYRHTAFEFVTDRLGAQGTVLAGGRYDGLIESLGGPSTPGVGWAAGVERLAMLLNDQLAPSVEAVVIPMGEEAETRALGVLADLRRSGVVAEMGFRGNMKRRLAKANDLGATYALILGEDELKEGRVVVRNLQEGKQARASLASIGRVPLSLLWAMDTGDPAQPGDGSVAGLLAGFPK